LNADSGYKEAMKYLGWLGKWMKNCYNLQHWQHQERRFGAPIRSWEASDTPSHFSVLGTASSCDASEHNRTSGFASGTLRGL